MQLYIIRHAQSYNNALWAKTGNGNGRLSDPHISEIGQQQANLIAQFIAQADKNGTLHENHNPHNRRGFHFTHLYASLMLRAVQTGHTIAEALNMPLNVWECIHEWGGIYEDDPETGNPVPQAGGNRVYFAGRFPRLILPDTLQEDGWWAYRPYEPREDSIHRARQFIHELLARHGGTEDRVCIVTHGGFTAMLINVIFSFQEINPNLGDEEFRTWLGINNTGFARIDFEEDRIIQTYMNRVDHLPAELITW
jgi:2,3-bisphosphoglycerate-dependent phosphoglycerate mutase